MQCVGELSVMRVSSSAHSNVTVHTLLTTRTWIYVTFTISPSYISGYIVRCWTRNFGRDPRSGIRCSELWYTMATSDSQLITAAADNVVHNGEQIASDIMYEGMLFKRQRGRSLRKGSGNRTKLKFQPRFCVLNNTGFMYKPKKSDKSKVCLANHTL